MSVMTCVHEEDSYHKNPWSNSSYSEKATADLCRAADQCQISHTPSTHFQCVRKAKKQVEKNMTAGFTHQS